MEPDKAALKKLWEIKWSRWLLYLAAVWGAISGLKDLAIPLYEHAARPAFIYVFGISPNPDAISYDRHAFLAGYDSYHVYKTMITGRAAEWPTEFAAQKNRLEASLISLGIPNAALVQEIDPANILGAIEKYQRIRTFTEIHLDKKSESGISAFYAGLDLALLIEESSSTSPSPQTIVTYAEDLKNRLGTIRSTTPNRLPTLAAETVTQGNCCSNLQKLFIDSYLELKKFYGVTLN